MEINEHFQLAAIKVVFFPDSLSIRQCQIDNLSSGKCWEVTLALCAAQLFHIIKLNLMQHLH